MNGTSFIPKLLAAFKGRVFWGHRRTLSDERSEALFLANVFLSSMVLLRWRTPRLSAATAPSVNRTRYRYAQTGVVAARLAVNCVPCQIVCGGATLDFLAGNVTRAPQWVRRLGFEWVFCLLNGPKRLFKRYVLGMHVLFK